ncbi:hypothetical protein LJR230_004949 [Trinickia sp. LjRoot230]|uniref:hypothetical protein n=1 Tax=Trinickia sp. LjRoot230 TaxID=3342288 RepID=UPI003ECFD599
MAITGMSIIPNETYSMANGNLVLPSEAGHVTYKVIVMVDLADNHAGGTVAITDLSNGVTVRDRSPIRLTANGQRPFALVHLQCVPETATEIAFKASATLTSVGNPTWPATPANTVPLKWVDAGALYPTLVATLAAPDDIPVLDTSDTNGQATITVTLTDAANAAIAGVPLLIGPTDQTDIRPYTFTDLTGVKVEPHANQITLTSGQACSVTTDASGRAGLKMTCPDNTTGEQAMLISWGAQLLGRADAHFFAASDDPLFVGPVTTVASGTIAAPTIYNAEGTLEYNPASNTTTCMLQVNAGWDNPTTFDKILLIESNTDGTQVRPRAAFSVSDCTPPTPDPGAWITYPLPVDRLLTGTHNLSFLAFKGGAPAGPSYSQPNPYKIGQLPAPAPDMTQNRVLPMPRIFVKSVDEQSNPIMDVELLPGPSVCVNWNYIKYGGLYVFIPYAATNGQAGMSGDAYIRIYRQGVYRKQLPVVAVPKTYGPVTVTDSAITVPPPPNLDPALGNGILMVIPTTDLSQWDAPPRGLPLPFQIEYWTAGGKAYSSVWTATLDTVGA